MTGRRLLLGTAVWLTLGWSVGPASMPAQSLGERIGRGIEYCTFERACNWGSHAAIAFGTTQVLQRMGVSRGFAAGAAAALFLAKEVRDHLKWGVLGTPDSNGDLASGIAGALIAYHLGERELSDWLVRPIVQPEARLWVGLRVYGPS